MGSFTHLVDLNAHRPFWPTHCNNRRHQLTSYILLKTNTSVHPKRSLKDSLQPCRAASVADVPTDVQPAWTECSNHLQSLGIEAEKIDNVLTRAFGWDKKSQGYWRQEKVNQPPSMDEITASIDFLISIGIETPTDQAAIITKFPEVLGLEKELMQDNVLKLEKAYFLKGKALVGAIKRKPRVLGSIVDCAGNCAGDCTRCFAQF